MLRKKECVEKGKRDMCLRRLMKHTLSEMVGVRMRVAGEMLFPLLGYDLAARWT